MELGLTRGESDVLAQLPQKFALVTAEAAGLEARDDEDAENVSFHQKRCCDHGAQTSAHQKLREGEPHLEHIRLVVQSPPQAARQAVFVDVNARLFVQSELHR